MKNIKINSGKLFFEDEKDLLRFDRSLYISGNLKLKLRKIKIRNTEDRIFQKLRLITNKIDNYLRPFTMEGLKFDLQIMKNKKAVTQQLFHLTGEEKKIPAFYYEINNTIYVSAKNANLEVISHEITHVSLEKSIAELFLPVDIKELISQFVSKNII